VVHLGGDALHPCAVTLLAEQADRSRVAGKRLRGESIYDGDWYRHLR
jgi:hypothetical protein